MELLYLHTGAYQCQMKIIQDFRIKDSNSTDFVVNGLSKKLKNPFYIISKNNVYIKSALMKLFFILHVW